MQAADPFVDDRQQVLVVHQQQGAAGQVALGEGGAVGHGGAVGEGLGDPGGGLGGGQDVGVEEQAGGSSGQQAGDVAGVDQPAQGVQPQLAGLLAHQPDHELHGVQVLAEFGGGLVAQPGRRRGQSGAGAGQDRLGHHAQ